MKAVMPRDKHANLKFNPKINAWDYRVRLTRPDGSRFVRAGSAQTEALAREKRNAAYKEFNADLGRAKEEQRTKRRDGLDTLSGWAERVLPLLKDECAPTTFEAYSHALENHVLPDLGNLPLEALKPLVISEHLQKLSSKFTIGVASQARSALARVLEVAAIDGRISSNPVKVVRVGARERKASRIEKAQSGETGKRWLSMEEGAHLLCSVRGSASYLPILLGLRFGLRSGESLGLTWEHVDIDGRVIKVRQQAQYLKGIPRHIGPPKSAAGVRDIPIPSDLLSELATAKREALERGRVWVCVDERGEPLHPKHVTRLIKDAVTRAGFDGSDGSEVPTSHDLRSSFLTWLANYANNGAGVKPHVLMKLAGHTDINIALKHYINAGAEDLSMAVNSLRFATQA